MGTSISTGNKGQDGKVMVMVLILLVIGTLLLTPLLGFMSTGLTAGGVYERKTAELYAADAGVMDAIWKIQSGHVREPQGCDNPTEFPYEYSIAGLLNHRNVNVSIDHVDDNTFRITSNATADGDSVTTIESYVFYGSDWGELLDFGLIALDGDIVIEGSSVVGSADDEPLHIYANGDIDLEGGGAELVKVWGSAWARGEVKGPLIRVSEDREEGVELVFGEPPDIDRYLDEAKAGGVEDGDWTAEDGDTLGPIHIKGNLYIEGQAEITLGGPVWVNGYVEAAGGAGIVGEGPIVAEGNIELTGTSAETPGKMPLIVSTKGTIQPTGTATIYAVLYAPNGEIYVGGDTSVNGAIVAKEITISTKGRTLMVSYDLDVVNRVRVPGLKIHTWEIK